jgi:eukaryotic translation initiation factor 2C
VTLLIRKRWPTVDVAAVETLVDEGEETAAVETSVDGAEETVAVETSVGEVEEMPTVETSADGVEEMAEVDSVVVGIAVAEAAVFEVAVVPSSRPKYLGTLLPISLWRVNNCRIRNGQFPPPDAEATKTEDAIAKDPSGAVAALSLDELTLPRRPGYGKAGVPVVLWTNYFELKGVKADTQLYRYSVAFQPDNELPKPKKKRLIQLLLQQAAFSGKPVASDWAQILISGQKLELGARRSVYDLEWYPEDGEPLPAATADESKQRARSRKKNTVRALVEELGTVSVKNLLSDLKQSGTTYPLKLETIQALNVVLGFGPSSDGKILTAGGNKYYPFGGHPQTQIFDLGSGLQALRGYFTSVRTSVNRILVNVNVATGAFYRAGPLLDLMREVTGGPPRNAEEYRKLAAFVRKLRFETNYIRAVDKNGKVKMESNRPVTKRKVHAIGDLSPYGRNSTDITFKLETNGKEETISVQNFFKRTHNITLQSPQAPAVNYGTRDNPKWIPAELCTVVGGQLARRLLLGDQTRRMIGFAARRPFDNAESIVKDGLQVTKISTGLNAHLTKFGIEVNPKMLTVNGRILPAPILQYRGTSTCRPQNGAWNLDVRQLGQKPFRLAKALGPWNCLCINSGNYETVRGGVLAIKEQLGLFKKTLETYGMSPGPVQNPVLISVNSADLLQKKVDSLKNQISQALRSQFKGKPNFLFVLLPNDNAALYDAIKTACDVELGVPNICSIASKFTKEKGQMQYFANVAMKFNQKLGGMNHQIELKDLKPLDASTIVFGIDVTHPSPGSAESSPSIAGVVASIDSHFSQYPASMRTQKGREEMVADLEEMIFERLKLWQKKNAGRLPSKVIVYRDGVSEGQFKLVMEKEYPHFVGAFNKLYGAPEKHPKVSLIVVGKRHHTRFYPTAEKDTDGRTGNPKPGTVVDRGVTGEKLFDFFLLAHQGLQGTSKPAHYVVLKDENKLGADQLQNLVSPCAVQLILHN